MHCSRLPVDLDTAANVHKRASVKKARGADSQAQLRSTGGVCGYIPGMEWGASGLDLWSSTPP